MSHLPLISIKTHLIEFIRHLQWEPLTIDIEIVGVLSQCVHSLITRIQEQRLHVVHAPAPKTSKNRVYLTLDVLPPENTQAVYLPSAAKCASRLEYRDVVISPLGPSETSDVESNSQQAQHKWSLQVTAELKIPLRYKKLFANFVKKTRPIFRVSFVWHDGTAWQQIDHDKIFHILNGNDGWQRYKPRVKKPGSEKKKKTVKREKGFVNVFSAVDMRAMKPEPITVMETVNDANISSDNAVLDDQEDDDDDTTEFAEIQRRQMLQSKLREFKQLQLEGANEQTNSNNANLEPPAKKQRTNSDSPVKPEAGKLCTFTVPETIPAYSSYEPNNYPTNTDNNNRQMKMSSYYSTLPTYQVHAQAHIHNYNQIQVSEIHNEPTYHSNNNTNNLPPPPYHAPQQHVRQQHHQQQPHHHQQPTHHHTQYQHTNHHQPQQTLGQTSSYEIPTFVPYVSPNNNNNHKRTYHEMSQGHSEDEDDVPIQPPIPARAGFMTRDMNCIGMEDNGSIEEEIPIPARFRRRTIFSNGKNGLPTNNNNINNNNISNNYRHSSSYGNFNHHSSFGDYEVSNYSQDYIHPTTGTHVPAHVTHVSGHHVNLPHPHAHSLTHSHTHSQHNHSTNHAAQAAFDYNGDCYFEYDYNAQIPVQSYVGSGGGNFGMNQAIL